MKVILRTSYYYFFCSSFVLGLLLYPARIFAAEVDRPLITLDRNFVIQGKENALEIPLHDKIETFIFENASNTCKISATAVAKKLDDSLKPTSPLWWGLDLLFPHSYERVHAKKIRILVDDFSSFNSQPAPFASYFIRQPTEALGLDCSAQAQAYWLPTLAHEFTHALLEDLGAESWFEEGLAQMMEHQMGGQQPDLSLKSILDAPSILFFQEFRRPLPDQKSYAFSYLFVSYIHNVYGGWPMLQAMTAPVTDDNYLRGLAIQAQIAMQNVSTVLDINQMTASDMIRNFYFALALKVSRDVQFEIPGWSGFATIPQSFGNISLEAGQAAISSAPPNMDSSIPSTYEVYQISEVPLREPVIRPFEPSTAAGSVKSTSIRQVYLIINISDL